MSSQSRSSFAGISVAFGARLS